MNPAISSAFQAILDQDGTTLCNLLKIVARDGTVLAVADLDVDLAFDDGGGEIVYSAPIGHETSNREAAGDLSVDNAEATLLLLDSGDFTEEKLHAGLFDNAKYWLYRVDFNDPSAGFRIVDYGRTGAMRVREGLAGVIELRGLQQLLKQSIVQLYSITCRARFGSFGRFGCGFDADSLWISRTVASVDSEEPDRIFTLSSAPSVSGPNGALSFAPGLVRFTSGNNAGASVDIEDVQGSTVYLRFPVAYDVEISDGLDLRPDCAKRYEEDCIGAYDNGDNFQGEPLIPLGDEGSEHTPGAQLPGPSSPVLLPEPDPPAPPAPDPDPEPPTPAPDSDIVNPGFEEGSTGWASGPGYSITSTSVHSGLLSAQLYSALVAIPITQTARFEVTPPVTINASVWVRSGAPSYVGGRVFLTWYDADGVWLSQDFGNTVTSSSWAQSSVSASAPGAAAFVTIGGQSQMSIPDFGHPLFFDDFAWDL